MRSDAVANQRKIVEAATRLMAERGLEAELTDIAHEAGVGVGTVYRCVGNRDQVIETIVRDAVGQMAASLDEAEAGDGGAENLNRLVERLHTIVGKYGWVHAALIGGREELRKEMRAIDPLRRFEALYERAQAGGHLRHRHRGGRGGRAHPRQPGAMVGHGPEGEGQRSGGGRGGR